MNAPPQAIAVQQKGQGWGMGNFGRVSTGTNKKAVVIFGPLTCTFLSISDPNFMHMSKEKPMESGLSGFFLAFCQILVILGQFNPIIARMVLKHNPNGVGQIRTQIQPVLTLDGLRGHKMNVSGWRGGNNRTNTKQRRD